MIYILAHSDTYDVNKYILFIGVAMRTDGRGATFHRVYNTKHLPVYIILYYFQI